MIQELINEIYEIGKRTKMLEEKARKWDEVNKIVENNKHTRFEPFVEPTVSYKYEEIGKKVARLTIGFKE